MLRISSVMVSEWPSVLAMCLATAISFSSPAWIERGEKGLLEKRGFRNQDEADKTVSREIGKRSSELKEDKIKRRKGKRKEGGNR
ncbi:hypothetical protein V2J09_019028 [Rumex salicifolius]